MLIASFAPSAAPAGADRNARLSFRERHAAAIAAGRSASSHDQARVAARYGYRIVDHHLVLFGRRIEPAPEPALEPAPDA